MSDYNSSLPVRTETAGDVIVKLSDATITSQQLTVNSDGSVNITDNSGSITVDATNLDIRDLSQSQDSVKIGDGTDFLAVNADGSLNITDNGGSLTIDGTVAVSNLPATVDTNYGAVGASTIRTAAEIGNATGAASFNAGATGAQTLRTESNQGAPTSVGNSWPVKITDGSDTMLVNTDGSINVSIADATPGTPINDYNTSAALAAAATSNHDYTVTALKTFYLNQVKASASAKMKIVVQIETGVATGVFTSKFVNFNSTANPNMDIDLDNPIAVAAGVRVRIARTNVDNQAQDVYSTICGYELP